MAGSIRKRGRGSWEVAINLGHDPISGKRKRRYANIKGSRKDAERALTVLLHERDTGTDVDPARITLAEWLGRWLGDVEHDVALSTFARYRQIVDDHLIPTLGSIRLQELRPVHVQGALSKWLTAGSRHDGSKAALSTRTVLHHYRLLHSALSAAVKLQLLGRNVCHAVTPPRPPRKEIVVLDPDQVRRMLEVAGQTPHHAFLHAAVHTGCRVGELLGLKWRDLDFGARKLFVRRTLKRIPGHGRVTGTPKTRRSERPISLSAGMVRTLEEHKRRQIEYRLSVGAAYQDEDYVFAGPTGSPVDDANLRRSFGRILKDAELPEMTLHGLRHTSASLLLRAGESPKTVAERLGHSSTSFTLDTYSWVLPDVQQGAADALDDLIGERAS